MVYHSTNGNGGAATILPPTINKVITGAGLANRRLDKRQRACLVADVIDGVVTFIPSQQQLAHIFGVSVPYIELARKLPIGKRTAILRGFDPVSFTDLMNPPRQLSLRGPVIPDLKVIPDTVLENLARAVGVDRLLAAAIAVEHNT
jgi:hypothetical protein